MENKFSVASEKLLIVIDAEKVSTDISLFKIILFAGIIFLLAFFIGLGEMIVVFSFLIIFVFGTNQVTELHFDKQSKSLFTAYSFFGKIVKVKKVLNDYSICNYKIVYETIKPVEDSYQVYTLRATEYYYQYNLYHLKKLDDAERVANWLVEHLGITFEEYKKAPSQH